MRKDDEHIKNENSTNRLPPFSFQRRSKKSESAFDPFAAEDFQITPLRKYSKLDTPIASDYGNKRKRDHNAFDKVALSDKESKRVHEEKQSRHHAYSTSTPMKEMDKPKHHHKHHKSKHKYDFSFLNSHVSPIEKLPKLHKHHVPELEDDFTYKPRPMVNTPESSLIRKPTPVFNTSLITSPIEIRPNLEASKSSDFSYPWEKSNAGKCSGMLDTESIFSRHESADAASCQSFLETAEKSNVFLRDSTENPIKTIFSQENAASGRTPQASLRTPQKSDIVAAKGNNSSLSRYRQKLLEEENEAISQVNQACESQNMSHSNVINSDNMFDTGDDFEYKPHRITPPTEDKVVDIMRLYQKEKETDGRDNSVLSNQGLRQSRVMSGVDVGVVGSGESDVKARRLSGGQAE